MVWRRITKKTPNKIPAIVRFSYDAVAKILIVEFADGRQLSHLDVTVGLVVGLDIASDKRDFYDTEIVPRFALQIDQPAAPAEEKLRKKL